MKRPMKMLFLPVALSLLFLFSGCQNAEQEEAAPVDVSQYDHPFLGAKVEKFESAFDVKATQKDSGYELELDNGLVIEMTADAAKNVYAMYIDFQSYGLSRVDGRKIAKDFLPPDAETTSVGEGRLSGESEAAYVDQYDSAFVRDTFGSAMFYVVVYYRDLGSKKPLTGVKICTDEGLDEADRFYATSP